jgi:hypothetical protein
MKHCSGLFMNHVRLGVCWLALAASSASSATELTLRDEQFAQTPRGREQLKYLVNCALPADVTVVATADNQRYTFPGGMGLAPGWSTQPLTTAEQRRVSACMLARTNFFGVPVQISVRNDAANASASLQTDDAERRDYPFFEAGFFGNLFEEKPSGFVCTGDTPPSRARHLRTLLRVCSLPGQVAQDISRCGFVMVGSCSEHAFVQNGVDYSADVLKVYLPAAK